ncbi:MAG: hypothetical protein DMD87_00725 [Candidatus Rokuibacteriota bacterium]|nr:MAG: hypothetical protein DMD87_00725 [Candidatus Rokubacteria bacterium]
MAGTDQGFLVHAAVPRRSHEDGAVHGLRRRVRGHDADRSARGVLGPPARPVRRGRPEPARVGRRRVRLSRLHRGKDPGKGADRVPRRGAERARRARRTQARPVLRGRAGGRGRAGADGVLGAGRRHLRSRGRSRAGVGGHADRRHGGRRGDRGPGARGARNARAQWRRRESVDGHAAVPGRAPRHLRRLADVLPARRARPRPAPEQPDLRQAPDVKLAIHQPHYLPWLGYFAKWAAADLFVFLDTVQYEKNGWQNRNRIKTREGARWLTVPVRARLGTPIRDVMVDSSQPWRIRHFAAIENAYGGAPCWARHRDELRALYGREWERLAPVAVASAEWLARKLGITTPTRLASEIGLSDGEQADATARLVGLCREVGADTYLAGRDGARYMDIAQFAAAGIAVETQQYEHPVYTQAYGEFVPSLSAVDLLLMHGDEALGILCEGSTWSRLSPEPT